MRHYVSLLDLVYCAKGYLRANSVSGTYPKECFHSHSYFPRGISCCMCWSSQKNMLALGIFGKHDEHHVAVAAAAILGWSTPRGQSSVLHDHKPVLLS